MGVLGKLKTKVKAHAAAANSGWPARSLELIFVSGQDSAQLSVTYLAAVMRMAGERVGVVTQRYIEIAGERVEGTDQADILGDIARLQRLLQQMKKAECRYVVIEIPGVVPAHGFTGLSPALLAIRRCGDKYLAGTSNTQRAGQVRKLLALHPKAVVWNRDDVCFDLLKEHIRHVPHSMTFGTHEKAECHITEVQLHPKGSAAQVVIDHQTELQLATHAAGKQAIYSMVVAAAAAYILEMPITAIEDGLLSVKPQPGYLQPVPADRAYQVVVDSSVTPEGVAEALEAVKRFTKNRVVAIVSAQLGQLANWRPVIGELVTDLADRIIVCDGDWAPGEDAQTVRSDLMKAILSAGGEARTEEIPDRQQALEKALAIARRHDIVVVLASSPRPYRQMGSDRLPWSDTDRLQQLVS